MLKKLLFVMSIALSISTVCQATVFVNENWDTGTPPVNWPQCGSGTSFNNWGARSWDCDKNMRDGVSGGVGAGLSTAIYHSPPRSFHNVKYPGLSYDAGEIGYALTSNFPSKIYVRFYLYLDNTAGGWATYGKKDYADDHIHFLFFNTSLSNTGFRLNLMSGAAADPWPPQCFNKSPKQNLFLNCQIGPGGGRGSNDCIQATKGSGAYQCWNIYNHFNEWHSYEFMLDIPNNLYSFWIDGNAVFTNLFYTSSSGYTLPSVITYNGKNVFQRFLFALFESGGQNGNLQYDYYLDDIVISDTYNGPLSRRTQ